MVRPFEENLNLTIIGPTRTLKLQGFDHKERDFWSDQGRSGRTGSAGPEKFEEESQIIEKKINDQMLWFPLRKALKNYTTSFGIKIINKNEPIIQLNSTIDSAASLLKKQLNEMKGIKYIETLKLTFKKTAIAADKNEPEMIFKTVYFNSKTKTIINENEVNESIQTSNQEILNVVGVWLSEGSGWTV